MVYTRKQVENLAKKYGVRYRGQSKREIADSLVAFRQQYMTRKEKRNDLPIINRKQK